MATKKRTSRSKAKAAAKPAVSAGAVPARSKTTAPRPRRLRQARYKTLRLNKRIKHPIKLPSIWKLSKVSTLLLWKHKGLFLGITVIYGLLNLILVQGLSGGLDVSALKHNLDQLAGGHSGAVSSSFAIFTLLVGSSGSTSNQGASGAYQIILLLVVSLACIWALRQVLAGTAIRIRDAYYRGMYPLVPFLLVMCVMALQLLPFIIGAYLYYAVTSLGIAVYSAERFAWGLLYAMLALLSLYMLTSSAFALYIVTLPDMTPLKALRSARGLVRNRRWTVLRKILFLPILLLIIAAVVMVPLIILVPVLAQWIFYFLTMLAVVAVHTYMYSLYRELLRD